MPSTYTIPNELSDTTRLGRQLAGGTVTVTGKSVQTGQHVTLTIRSRAKQNGKWKRSSFADRMVAFVEETHSRRRVAIVRHNGEVIEQATGERGAALLYTLRQALREALGVESSPAIELTTADRCGCCGRMLTDPESIERGIGPDCLGKQTASQYAKAL